jgi:hypothetical protein
VIRRLLLALALTSVAARCAAPDFVARSGDRCVVLHWSLPAGTAARIEKIPLPGTNAAVIATSDPTPTRLADFAVTNGVTYRYRLVAVSNAAPIAELTATPAPFIDDTQLLDFIEVTAVDYFWREANPTNGLIRDRTRADSKCSIAAVGFGLSGLCVGAERGWLPRAAVRDRVRTTLRTFAEGPQSDDPTNTIGHHGWFYHFLEMDTARRAWRCELSSIDTALLLAGILDAAQFFDRPAGAEQEIRDLAARILQRVDWRWMATPDRTFSMGWHPERGFIPNQWRGYNEAMLLYVLALGASDDPGVAWSAWTATQKWQTHHGQSYVPFPPLFGHQYSHCWIVFQGLADDFLRPHEIDYAENSRRATLAQQAYCVANPGKFAGYGPRVWGLTACDGPDGYRAHGAPPLETDDGTIAPTAAGASVPFAPEICIPTLRHFYDAYRERLWTPYGFRDAFNLSRDWWATDVLGIDQGPMLLMIENHRSGSTWRRMQKHPVLVRGLERAGFKPL